MFSASPIGRLFGQSPFKPIQEHMKIVAQCAEKLSPLFEAVRSSDPERISSVSKEIFDLEHQADDLKNDIRAHLPKGLFMPVDRRDLLDLLHTQDSIADTVQDVAGLVSLRPLTIPADMEDSLIRLVDLSLQAASQAASVIGELDELLEVGFRGREAEKVELMIQDLSRIESAQDKVGTDLTRQIFQDEESLTAGTLIILYELSEKLGDVADHAEAVGNKLRLLIAR